MNIRYKREMRHNYLILEAEEKQENFEIRMLTGNFIEGLLKFRVKDEEHGQYYYYEITSKQPLSRLLEVKEIRREELSRLIIGIGSVLKRMEDYLLQEANILLEPEQIYIEPETFQVWLCYVPGYQGNFPKAMEKFLQYLLKKTDHKDNYSVVLAYRLYQESQKDYYGIEDLLQIIREEQTGNKGNDEQKQRIENQKSGKRKEENKEKDTEDIWTDKEPAYLLGEKYEKVSEKKPKEDRYSGRQKKSRKESGKGIGILLAFLLLGPGAVWLMEGSAGIQKYGVYLLAADIGAVMLFFFIGFLGKKGKTEEKENVNLQEKKNNWYMEFEEEEEEAEKDAQALSDRYKNPAKDTSSEPVKKMGGNTVLLAENLSEGKKQHLLKSLNPSVMDIPVPYFPFIIGKQEGIVDYVLNRDTVSRLHLKIEKENGECHITDLNSSNGTSVEEYSLEANESYPLNSGDKLMIADIPFIFY